MERVPGLYTWAEGLRDLKDLRGILVRGKESQALHLIWGLGFGVQARLRPSASSAL